MARIAGVDLPGRKRIEIALTYIYGIGLSRARLVLENTKINPDTKVGELNDAQITAIRGCLEDNFKIEGDLRKEVSMSIKRLMSINCYRGIRHKRHLPCRGQKTKTNARTRKGPRKGMVKKKK